MRFAIFLSLIIGQCFAFRTSEEMENRADFCGHYDCPDFTVVETHDGYELRKYNSSVWVVADCPEMESDYWDDRDYQSEVFMKLFGYIQGANDQKVKIDMTVPVLKAHAKDSVSMSFMLPPEHAENPPTPTDSSLKFYTSSGGNMFVRSFGGFPYGIFGWENYYKTELEYFNESLTRDGVSFDDTMFHTASYDSPWKWFNRHNEVWLRPQ